MSAADDVLETKTLFEELAEAFAPRADDKERVRALHKGLRDDPREELFSWNRVFELLKGKARRVDAWEKDYARRRVAELRDAEQRRLEGQYLDWLQSSDPQLRGPMLDRLELVLRSARGGAGAVAVSEAAEDIDQSTQWPGA